MKRKNIMRSCNGFTLIEVLITMLLLGVGILGIAGLQSVSVTESQNTYFRTQANMLANDMVERLHANREASHIGSGNGYEATSITPGSCSSDCTASELAAFDLYEWYRAILSSRLPEAVGQVTRITSVINDSGSIVGAIYRIEIIWDEDRDGQIARSCDVTTSDGCVRLVVHV